MTVNHITDAVRAIIGACSDWVEAPHPVESSELRRFHQATMDPTRRYWDKAFAEAPIVRRAVSPWRDDGKSDLVWTDKDSNLMSIINWKRP